MGPNELFTKGHRALLTLHIPVTWELVPRAQHTPKENPCPDQENRPQDRDSKSPRLS